jgi:hypothetical protein
MKRRRDILQAHYLGVLKKVGTWSGLIAILATMAIAGPAYAVGQVTTRSATLSDSGAGDTAVSYTVKFTAATTTVANGTKSVRFQFCTSPLYNTTCTLPAGLVRGTGISAQTDNGTTLSNAFTAATSGTTDVLLSNATGDTFTSGHNYVFGLTGFTNPTAINSEFYVRVITCSDTTCTMGAGTNIDAGGYAVSTTQVLSVSATVQESLVFCVGTTNTNNCGSMSYTPVTLTPSPMGVSAPSLGSAYMAASTNAATGYVISYNATSFTDTTADTICTGACATGLQTGAALGNGGAEQFGFDLVANTNFGNTGPYGTAPTNSGTATAPYATNNSIAYNLTNGTNCASYTTGPTPASQEYDISYGANVAATTKPGSYTATQTFIATSTF